MSRTSTFDNPSLRSVSRTDTSRSSISVLARGMIRHVPDVLMFHQAEKKTDSREQESNVGERRTSRDNRHGHSDQGPVEPKPQRAGSAPNPPHISISKPELPMKATLKDRRKLAQKEAMQLTLPLDIPVLPSRNRLTIGDSSNIAPSRSRSPKTPWGRNGSTEWYTPPPRTPRVIPDIIVEDDEPIYSPKTNFNVSTPMLQSNRLEVKPSKGFSLSRIRWRLSNRNLMTNDTSSEVSRDSPDESRTQPILDQASQPHQELKAPNVRSRARRFLWSGENLSSPNLSGFTRFESSQSPFSVSRFVKPRRLVQQYRDLTPPTKGVSNRRRAMSTDVLNSQAIDAMHIPPSFVPPGLHRVPTPPTLDDSNGEVKGQLADFFFDLEGVRTHKAPPTPGGHLWDSDALLMPQNTDFGPPSPVTDPGIDPMKRGSVLNSNSSKPCWSTTLTTPSGGTYSQVTPPQDLRDIHWVPDSIDSGNSKDAASRATEDITKLEWMTPEHLPNSPLCPLHEKYRGRYKGFCVYHGKRMSLSEAITRTQNGHRGRGGSGPATRGHSSALDGSEDAGVNGGKSVVLVSATAKRKRKWRLRMSIP